MEYGRRAIEASQIIGVPIDACINYEEYMKKAGFEDVCVMKYKMPSSAWAKDKRLKLVGAFEMENLLMGISGMSLRAFAKAYGWSPQQTEVYLVNVRKDLRDLRFHTYYEL